MLWCQRCKIWVDREVYAAINLSDRGLARFASSLPQPVRSPATTILLAGDKGLVVKAAKRNQTKTVILSVNASKSVSWSEGVTQRGLDRTCTQSCLESAMASGKVVSIEPGRRSVVTSEGCYVITGSVQRDLGWRKL